MDYVNFGEATYRTCGQTQYVSRYVNPNMQPEYPNLGAGLCFEGNVTSYHNFKIHKDDVEKFINRFKKYQEFRLKWTSPDPSADLTIDALIKNGEI